MPSLMPGMPGTKETYGISIIKDNFSITIPPKAFERYGISNNDLVLLSTTHIGEGGLSILIKEKAYKTVFKRIIDKIENLNSIILEKNKAYTLTKIKEGKIFLNNDLLKAFNLKTGDKLMVVKSTTIAMSYTPIEIWKKKFEERGLFEAVENMKTLKEF